MAASSSRALLRPVRRWLRNRFFITLGMRGTAPINPAFGAAEGTPIDRHYIALFLEANREHITGRVLEIGDRSYTERFGVGVTRSDVLNAVPSAEATYVGDLASCPEIPDATYDCLVLTQMLHYVFDMRSAVGEIQRILRPGGTVLCTVPGITHVSRYDMERWGDRWRLTSQSAAELFATAFEPEEIAVSTYGNAYSSVCFMQGVPSERLHRTKLDRLEPDYQLLVAIAATRRTGG